MTGIAPWLSVNDATHALAFYRTAFGAIELERLEDDAGNVILAELSIDGADFWIQTDAASRLAHRPSGRSVWPPLGNWQAIDLIQAHSEVQPTP